MESCVMIHSKNKTARSIVALAQQKLQQFPEQKLNLIWLEATGCSGNIISLMNGENPDIAWFLRNMVWLRYNNSLMAAEGEEAYGQFLDALSTDFILVVEGAVSIKDDGRYNVIASYQGKRITGLEAVKRAGEKAKYVLAVGTCASHGGPSAARPNPSGSVGVNEVLDREVIRIPGCPGHPDWIMGTLAHLIYFGKPELDSKNRPKIFYGISVHDRCTRRAYFDQGIFAKQLGDSTCMFKLGCRGPITRTDCPVRQWNGYVNWPIGDNTPCIGCAQERFPDGMEPFVRY